MDVIVPKAGNSEGSLVVPLQKMISLEILMVLVMCRIRRKGEDGTASCWAGVNEGVLVASGGCIVRSDNALNPSGFDSS